MEGSANATSRKGPSPLNDGYSSRAARAMARQWAAKASGPHVAVQGERGGRGPRWRRVLVRGLFLLGLLLAASVGALSVYASRLPDPAGLPKQVQVQLAAHDGEYVSLSDVPPMLQQAIIATEDATFYSNPGISLEALGRAVVHNVQLGWLAEGGSTISQQLVKVVYLDGHDRTARRKLDDTVLALEMNRQLSKPRILELYLNAIYYGHNAYGVGQAAQIYFHQPVSSLDLAQCALLAGLPRAPSLLDPTIAPEKALARRATVLDQMAALGMITQAQAQAAQREPLLP